MKLLNDMFTIERQEGSVTTIRLNPEHEIYKAHFPGNPITPGVCIVQIITEVLREKLGIGLCLQKLVNLKFISTLSPQEHDRVNLVFSSIDRQPTMCKVRGTISSGEVLFTKFSIIYKYA